MCHPKSQIELTCDYFIRTEEADGSQCFTNWHVIYISSERYQSSDAIVMVELGDI